MSAEPNTFQQVGEVASASVNLWSWYFDALKGKFGPIHDGYPQQGYYRVRSKGGQWEPVAIWFEDGAWLAYRNGREVRADEIWSYCCRQPIEHAAYEKAMAGGGFDDEPPAPIGDNSGAADPLEAIRVELAGEVEQVNDFLKSEVTTQAAADRIGIWSKRLTDLAKRADNHRVTEKEPHLAASRAVDDRWRDVIADAKDCAAKAKKALEGFLIAKKRAEEARARAEAEEAARLRREAEDRAKAAARADVVDEAAEAERAELIRRAQEAEKAAEVRNAQAGRTGAKVALRSEKRAKIVDFDVCLMALKDRAEIRELVQSLANRAVKSGFPLAGVEVEIFEKVA
jgi:hypothetical protein